MRLGAAHMVSMSKTEPSTTAPFQTTLTVSAQSWTTMFSDRDAGHRMVMDLWGQLPRTEDRGPRAHASILWAPLSLDPATGSGQILVRSAIEPRRLPGWVLDADTTQVPAPSGAVRLRLDLVATYTPNGKDVPEQIRAALKAGSNGTARAAGQGLSYRKNPVALPEERVDFWARQKLAHAGVASEEVTVLGRSSISLRRRGGGYPTISLDVTGDVVAQDLFAHHWQAGVGRGKNFGLGMIRAAN